MKLRLHEQARSGTSEADFRTAATTKVGSIGQCGGSYCRRPDSVSGWMVSAVCQRLLLTNHFCHSYQPKMAIIPTFFLWFRFAQQLRPCFFQPCRRPSGVRRACAGKTQNPYRAAAYIPLRSGCGGFAIRRHGQIFVEASGRSAAVQSYRPY